jgi:hypothetical protein
VQTGWLWLGRLRSESAVQGELGGGHAHGGAAKESAALMVDLV